MTTTMHTHPTLDGRPCAGKHCADHRPKHTHPTLGGRDCIGKHCADHTS